MSTNDKFRGKYRIISARLPEYDYEQNGYYYVTICTSKREEYFGSIIEGDIVPSAIGKIAHQYWQAISDHFPYVVTDEFVVMPNHVHGILILERNANNAHSEMADKSALLPGSHKYKFGPQSGNLASIIRGYKAGVTKYARMHNIPFDWQPRFYDHIIRDEKSLSKIREYIRLNPKMWPRDRNNLENLYQ